MENPVINTWEQGTRLVESSSRMIQQRFPCHRLKALMGWEGIVVWDKEVDPVDMLDAYQCLSIQRGYPCLLGGCKHGPLVPSP